MARHKDINWDLPGPKLENWEQAQVALLMDIRDEMHQMNAILNCPNFIGIPGWLRSLDGRMRAVEHRLQTISRKIPARKRRSRA